MFRYCYMAYLIYVACSVHMVYANRAIVEQMMAHSQPNRTYLLSFPRSGNTWLRYCIEVLTQRPTGSYVNTVNKSNLPLGYLAGHSIDLNKNPVWKVHWASHMNFAKFRYSPASDKLIFIIRNPKETLIKHCGMPDLNKPLTSSFANAIKTYNDNLSLFHGWNSAHKLLVCYEDLITSPAQVLLEIMQFLGDSPDSLNDFFARFEYHKQTAIQLYAHNGSSESKGDDILYHSRKIPAHDREKLEALIKNASPSLWDIYLNDKYSEKVLEAQGLYQSHMINQKKSYFRW